MLYYILLKHIRIFFFFKSLMLPGQSYGTYNTSEETLTVICGLAIVCIVTFLLFSCTNFK